MSIIQNVSRVGNFTSSEIVALTTTSKDGKSFGVPALTYIEECNMERRLGRSLTDESFAKPLVWGKLLEKRAFKLLGLEYQLTSDVTIIHPDFDYWSGSPDGFKHGKVKTVNDIKCPMTLKSFCQLVDPLYHGLLGIEAMNAIRKGFTDEKGLVHAKHKDGEKFYWQLVSNSCLSESSLAELIVYVPYKSELEEIKWMAQNVEPEHLSKHYWIAMGNDDELPHLIDGGFYQNINKITFEVPEEDKILLTENVIKAGKMLVDNPSVILAEFDSSVNATIIE